MQTPFGNSFHANNNENDGGGYENIEELRTIASKKLVESGERDRLMKLLKQRLSESGWRDELILDCKRIVRDRGVDNITVDQLVAQVQPGARKNVPDAVKQELFHQIRDFLTKVLMPESYLND